MQSSSENQEDYDLGNEDYDSNNILEMNTFAEFKNYETENVILNHLKKLHDNTNGKIFKIFYDSFVSKYPDDKVINGSSNENSITNKNIQITKTKLRGMLIKKNDDGIMSFLFIREEFEKIIKEKEEMIEKLIQNNFEIEEKIRGYERKSFDMDKQINDLKQQLNKKEAELKIDFLKNLESESEHNYFYYYF
jgi:flagellar capping protein FliD